MEDTSKLLRILADDARLRMLWLLMNHPELCVCDFVAVLGITQSKASRHLRTLWHGRLVTDRKEGLWSYYSLCPPASEVARLHLEVLRSSLALSPESAGLLVRLEDWLKSGRSALRID